MGSSTDAIAHTVGARVNRRVGEKDDATMAGPMSKDHKAALAKGRAQGRAVREYLAALEQERKPGRKLDRPTAEARIADDQSQIDDEPDPAKRVELIQKRLDL